jgi:hypothetical protein
MQGLMYFETQGISDNFNILNGKMLTGIQNKLSSSSRSSAEFEHQKIKSNVNE